MPLSRLLNAHMRQVIELEDAAIARLLAIYQDAEDEIAQRIAALDASGRGESFTAQHLVLLLAQIRFVFRTMRQSQGRALGVSFREALITGAQQTLAETRDLERRFGEHKLAARLETIPPVIPAQQVARLALPQNLALARFEGVASETVSRSLALSVTLGEGVQQATARVRTAMDGQTYQLERIARTEIQTAANHGHMQTLTSVNRALPEMKLQKQWSAHLDYRVCRTCGSMHLQVRDIDQPFESVDGWRGQQPTCHPNDRCRVMPYSPRWEARSVKKIADEAYGTPRNPLRDK